ncbi:YLP motif-containing protein 1 isoform X2 [Atheta coriaria]|uniref:YLP motif-containing protein 1 isoform X2 n=1 Tax=Dalotia coriaria TaxID=877792 RepID=UPI0031F43C3E
MSWPQWQPPAQPAMPMMNNAMPMGIQYSAEQWQQMQQQNWQQWAQWQQQYQQWHQQYGAEYQKSLTAMANIGTISPSTPILNTAVPPPLPNDAKPPPPPEEPQQNQLKTNKNTFQNNANIKPAYGYNSLPPQNNQQVQNQQQRQLQGKRQALEHQPDIASSKKNKLDWQPPPTTNTPQVGPQLPTTSVHPQPQPQQENKEDLSDPEKKFMKQFAEWEAQFNKWKEQNQDHPDKAQYREYEKKWEAWRNQLLERRELMRKKRLGLLPANVNINTSLEMNNGNTTTNSNPKTSTVHNALNTDTTDVNKPINTNALSTIFKSNLNDGIPGLDLVDAPGQPDDIPPNEQKPANNEVQPALNLEALSKNLNSILGDQKLLNILSLVAQNTNPGAAAIKNEVISTPPVVAPTIPSGITLAPAKVQLTADDQTSNWSTNTNTSGNSTAWSQEKEHKFDPSQNNRFGVIDSRHGGNNDRSYQEVKRFDEFNRNEARFGPNNHNNSFEEEYWSPNGVQDDIAPAPPTIASFDELLQIDKIVDYDHKTKKQDTTDVRVFTPRLFDYRHKLVTRIPLPERPRWLSETFHNIPEFDPPISRTAPPYLRDRYPPGPSGNYIDNQFSRRPFPPQMGGPSNSPLDYDMSYRPDDDFRRRNNSNHTNNNNKDDYERFKRQKWVGRGDNRDNRSQDSDRDRERDRNRLRDKEDKNKDNKRDVKESTPATNANTNSFAQNQQLFSAALKMDGNRVSQAVRTNIDDLLNKPGRAKRPQRIVIVLRGPPGSGKTFLAKQIKDKETENGGSAPRILSLDDYFMVEQEKEVVEDGKTIKVKEMVYEYEECMEASYRQSLLKTFKKTITDGYFPFIIVDNVNDKVKYFDGMWSFAKQNGFQVYICQLDLDVQICTKRNIHGRSEVEIQHIVNGWEEVPSHYGILDATNLIQAGAITEVEMEEINSPNDDFDDEENEPSLMGSINPSAPPERWKTTSNWMNGPSQERRPNQDKNECDGQTWRNANNRIR